MFTFFELKDFLRILTWKIFLKKINLNHAFNNTPTLVPVYTIKKEMMTNMLIFNKQSIINNAFIGLSLQLLKQLPFNVPIIIVIYFINMNFKCRSMIYLYKCTSDMHKKREKKYPYRVRIKSLSNSHQWYKWIQHWEHSI